MTLPYHSVSLMCVLTNLHLLYIVYGESTIYLQSSSSHFLNRAPASIFNILSQSATAHAGSTFAVHDHRVPLRCTIYHYLQLSGYERGRAPLHFLGKGDGLRNIEQLFTRWHWANTSGLSSVTTDSKLYSLFVQLKILVPHRATKYYCQDCT